MHWWAEQIQFARLVARSDRVGIKAGHSVGKTHAIAGIVIWYLHAFEPAIIVTTAPSSEQVISEIWQEIRRQAANAKEPLFKGLLPKNPYWQVSDGWYATGFSTDKGDRFRGKHGPNMLFVFDEATGVPEFVWEETLNMCTAPNNKIVAIGNPVNASGQFFEIFKPDSMWDTMNISCLRHPNVVQGTQVFPGAVSRQWVTERINKLCIPVDTPDDAGEWGFQWPEGSERWWKPSNVFMSRVLGEFPIDDPDALISFTSIVAARTKSPQIAIDELSVVDLGVDVAERGGDASVVFARRGPCAIKREKWYDRDTEYTARKVISIARAYRNDHIRVGTIAVDAIGIGSGVAARLQAAKEEGELICDRVIAVHVSEKAVSSDKYDSKRAELLFALKERFETGNIDLTRLGEDATDLELTAPQIKWDYDRLGRYRVESKDTIRKRIRQSPDDLDALALAYIDSADTFAENFADVMDCG